jgi:hypothetical protein
VLWLKEGADCSLLASPEKTNVMLEDPTEDAALVDAVAEEAPDPERRSIQGTTTCLPLVVDDDNAPLLVVELDVLLVPVPLVVPAPPETERIAKSIRPDEGLMMTSLTVPRFWPEELVTWALLSSDARMCWCCCMRPVALRELPLVLEDPNELPDVLGEPWLLEEPCWEPDE